MAKIKTDDVGAMLKNARQAAGDFGKFYTPECLSKLIARLASDGLTVDRVLDPACGCGSLLVYGHEVIGDAFYVGQEISADSCALARKNLHENGVDRHEIINCDTLEFQITWEEKFDVVLANPPFSVKWNPDAVPFDPRFNGVYAPKGKADLAFVQHGLYWLRDGGRAAYILPPGALSRSGAEQKIREQFMPYVRAVVTLPVKLFEETAIGTVCLLFEKSPSEDPVLFLDASEMCESVQKKLNVITDGYIDEIVAIVKERKVIEERSALVERSAINDFDLSPYRYIEKTIKKEKGVYDDWTPLQVLDDGDAWAEYTYRLNKQMSAKVRKTLGYEYNQEDLDFDVEAIKPDTYDYHKAQGHIR